MSNDNEEPSKEIVKIQKKQPKRGIIYLSSIPQYMNVTIIREIFSAYGTLGRVYLQLAEPDSKAGVKKSKRKISKKFTEGWIEFEKKSVAKKVVTTLNNTQVSTRKKSKQYDCIWNLKYLHNFKWTHLHERLAYEKAARRQKIRTEIQLAKKKTNFFTTNLDRHKKNKQFVNKDVLNVVKPAETKIDESIDDGKRNSFLQSLFN